MGHVRFLLAQVVCVLTLLFLRSPNAKNAKHIWRVCWNHALNRKDDVD